MLWRFGLVVTRWSKSTKLLYGLTRFVLGWMTVSVVQLTVRENLLRYITDHPGQLSLAIPPWVGAVSTTNDYGHR